MHAIIPYMFDCWADPAVHLLLLNSSIPCPMLMHELLSDSPLLDLTDDSNQSPNAIWGRFLVIFDAKIVNGTIFGQILIDF